MASRISEWRDKLGKKYRAVIMEEETLFEAGTYRYTKGRILLFSVIAFLLVVIFTTLLVFNTPFIRELIPGYSRENEYEQQQELMHKLAILEDALVQRDSFLASLQRISGDPSAASRPAPVASELPEESMYTEMSASDQDAHDYPGHAHEDDHSHAAGDNSALLTEKRDAPLKQVRIGSRKMQVLPGNLMLIPPVEGVVTSVFNPGQKHYGLDLAAPANALIRSVADGHVIFSEWSDQNGYVIGVMHTGGMISMYKHNRILYKKTGAQVYAGEAIAVIGNSGQNSSGPHLHFELWFAGSPVNPLDYFALN